MPIRDVMFVVTNEESSEFLSPSGTWFPDLARAMHFGRCEDALGAAEDPGCVVRVVCDGELLAGAVYPPGEGPGRG